MMNPQTIMTTLMVEARYLVMLVCHAVYVNVTRFITDIYGDGYWSSVVSGTVATAVSFLLWIVVTWAH